MKIAANIAQPTLSVTETIEQMPTQLKRILLAITQLPLLPLLAAYVLLTSFNRTGPRPTPTPPKQIALITPCEPGIKSGTERAIRDMQEMLTLSFELNIIPLHKLNPKPNRLKIILARWIGAVIPLDDLQRRFIGDPSPVLSRVGASDLVLIEFSMSAAFLFFNPKIDVPIVIRDHEVLARRFSKELAAASSLIEKFLISVKLLSAWLLTFHLYLFADRIVALTPEDAAWMKRWFPMIRDRIIAIPVSFAVSEENPIQADTKPRDLIYAANFYHRPNIDGLLWLLSECGDLVDPNVTLHLVGIDTPLSKIKLPNTNFNVVRHGHIENIETDPAISGINVALAPIISGGGIRVKNLLFGSFSKAIVTTSLGNEGVGFHHDEEAMICDTPQAFAAAINKLTRDPELAARMGNKAREAVKLRFSHEAILSKYKTKLFSTAP